MKKYSFKNDYSEGCHPRILEALQNTNNTQELGYGEDSYCQEAAKIIQKKCNNAQIDVHFVTAGTQANLLVISAALRSYESVISADTGHIHVHETGAIEAIGHKIQIVKSLDGKLNCMNIQKELNKFENEHTVKPRMVYISNSSEIGTIYNEQELKDLSSFCKKNNLLLFMDGARLGSALTAKTNDLTLESISNYCDVFYIGGTKNGGLFGEAIIIKNQDLKSHFRFHQKQRGALLAKGRVLGVQFHELFKDDLFFELAQHANTMAEKLTKSFQKNGFEFLVEPVSNQIFPILPNTLINKLKEHFDFYVWKEVDENHSVIRIVTSWATKEEPVKLFIDILKHYRS